MSSVLDDEDVGTEDSKSITEDDVNGKRLNKEMSEFLRILWTIITETI